jgi:AcrR family transcriptional regulator
MSIVRARLSPEESRSQALDAARRLLIDQGPQAVTLKAVSAEIGKTHANLLHHFGSAAGLQAELARSISDQVTRGHRAGGRTSAARRERTRARSSTAPSTCSARAAPAHWPPG